ncbi:MAG: site-specific integrase [Sulfuritalea sp.]|jgi:integrase|nr:site-specific integrase [Sulfuritalea sp.]
MPYRRKGSPYWWVKFTDASGKPTYRSTRTTDLNEAKALEAKWRHEAHQLLRWGIEPEHTFDEMMHAFITAKQSEWRAVERVGIACRRLQPHFTGMAAERIRRADVSSYIQKRKNDGVSGSTINRELDLLSAASNFARITLEWNVQNPVTGMSLKEPQGRLRWIKKEEAERLIGEASKEEKKSPHLADFIRLALNTGCRKNELLKLSWDRVDLVTGCIRLEGENTKNGKRRFVPLSDVARSALANRARFRDEHCPKSPWVFSHENGKRVQFMQNGFQAACSRAKITDFRVHDLRHTCASWLVSAGVPLLEVKELLGHGSIEMTERYAHLAPENLGRVALVLNRLQSSDIATGERTR